MTKDEVDIHIKRNTDIMSFFKKPGLSGGELSFLIISIFVSLLIFGVIFGITKKQTPKKDVFNDKSNSEKINYKIDTSKIWDKNIDDKKIMGTEAGKPIIKT